MRELSSPQPAPRGNFGAAVAFYLGQPVVGAYRNVQRGVTCGEVYVFDRERGALIATLSSPRRGPDDEFGMSVAPVGPFLVVGADQVDGADSQAGAVYIYRLRDLSPQRAIECVPARIIDNPSLGAREDFFGKSLADHQGRAVVGSHFNDLAGKNAGAVLLVDPLSGALRATILNPRGQGNEEDCFGLSLAVSGDRLVVGSPQTQDRTNRPGAAWVYDLGGRFPQLVGELLSSTSSDGDEFGCAVAQSDEWIAVGARLEPGAAAPRAGGVHLFDAGTRDHRRRISRECFGEVAVSEDWFGFSVLFAAGFLFVGAPGVDSTGVTAPWSGAVYVIDPADGSLVRRIAAPRPSEREGFGASLAADQDLLLVGAPGFPHGPRTATSEIPGKAYVFRCQ